jgi:uncharacterized membrane protein YgcG
VHLLLLLSICHLHPPRLCTQTLNEQEDYVEYHGTLKGGMLTHNRILVLYSKRRTFSILDDKRKLRHEHNLADVMSIELPLSNHTSDSGSGGSGGGGSSSGGSSGGSSGSGAGSASGSSGAAGTAAAGGKKNPELFIVFKKQIKEKPINFEFNDGTTLSGGCCLLPFLLLTA